MPKVCVAIAHLKGTLKALIGGGQKNKRKYWKGMWEAPGRPVSRGRLSKGKGNTENEKEPRQ